MGVPRADWPYLDYEDSALKCGYADFSHLLLWADDVLATPHSDDYDLGMRHIMVDEYQDGRPMELILGWRRVPRLTGGGGA